MQASVDDDDGEEPGDGGGDRILHLYKYTLRILCKYLIFSFVFKSDCEKEVIPWTERGFLAPHRSC